MNWKPLLFCLLPLSSMIADSSSAIPHTTISAIGTILPRYKSTLGSTISGRVLEVMVDVGTYVKKDQPLLKLDPLFFLIDIALEEATLKAAQVELEDAKLNFQRMNKLWNKPEGQSPSISRKKFEDAQLRYDKETAAVLQATENLKKSRETLNESIIKAPYDGVITKRLVHPGESIEPSTALLEIEAIDTVYVEFSVPQAMISSLHVGTPITIEAEGLFSEKKSAIINLIWPYLDEKTRSIKCRSILDNRTQELHPGALVRVQISLSDEPQ